MMVKHKIISRYGVTKYCIRSKKGQQLDEMAVQRLRTGEVPGLLFVEADRKKNFFQLIYDVTGLTSLDVFLRQTMTRNVFIRLVRGIVGIFTAVPERHLELSKIVFEPDSIFINPASSELFYIYVPIGGCDSAVTLRDILLTVSSLCQFSPGENNEYVSQFMKFISERTNISKLELGTLLDQLEGRGTEVWEAEQKQCPHCGGMVKADSDFCTSCGQSMHAAPAQPVNTYDPFSNPGDWEKRSGQTGGDPAGWMGDGFYSQPMGRSSGGQGTSVLGDPPTSGSEGTMALDWQNQQSPSYLIRRRTGERITLDSFPFRIGKEQSQCNYAVPDNRAVSRNHADIFLENDVYMIQDNASTNGTYIDGRRIESYRKTELASGAKLRLANEDFIFHIEEDGQQ